MAATSSARAFMLSSVTELSKKKPILHPPPTLSPSPSCLSRRLPNHVVSTAFISCLSGGGVSSDDYYVSTRRLDQGFAVIANMVSRIEPLDTSVISKGVSDSAKDSMKQTISSMLGLLPSDQFSVSVTVSEQPLHRLVISSIITGYTLWNADYRLSLTRNLDIPVDAGRKVESSKENMRFGSERELTEDSEDCVVEMERISPQVFGDLTAEASNYVQRLQSELCSMKRELDGQKKQTLRIESERRNKNDLLEYLRSLDPEMVTELSQPSSSEVEQIIHQLVPSVLWRIFKGETSSGAMEEPVMRTSKGSHAGGDETLRTVGTSRDYLAKLLFWCMLLGHHLRGLENRLHLSCAVGLL